MPTNACAPCATPAARVDLGDSVAITITTTDPVTGEPVAPVSLACAVRDPAGTWADVPLTAAEVGTATGAYHTAGSTRGLHLGKVTAIYLNAFQTVDYFRVTAVEPY